MKHTKYEVARIIGARALQLAMGAPFLIKRPKNEYSPVRIAIIEFEKGLLPITIKRPRPKRVKLDR